MGAVLWSAVLHAALHSTQPLQPLHQHLPPMPTIIIGEFNTHLMDSYSYDNCKVMTLQWAFESNLHDLEKLCEKKHMKSYEKSCMKSYMHCFKCGLVII